MCPIEAFCSGRALGVLGRSGSRAGSTAARCRAEIACGIIKPQHFLRRMHWRSPCTTIGGVIGPFRVAIAVVVVAFVLGLPVGACAAITAHRAPMSAPCHDCCPKPAQSACHNPVCICLDTPQPVGVVPSLSADCFTFEVNATLVPAELGRETATDARSAVYSPPDPYLIFHQILI